MQIMQGDSYSIPFSIKSANGVIIDDSMVDTLEVTIGHLRKIYPGSITYHNERWQIPLGQGETVKLNKGDCDVQVRIKFKGGHVVGRRLQSAIHVGYSGSKVII